METPEETLRRTVHETLDSIVSPAVRDTFLTEALTAAGLPRLPNDVDKYLDFLDGPLRRILEQALGRELGRSVVEELARLSSHLEGRDPESERLLEAARARAARSPAAREGGVIEGGGPGGGGSERRPTRSDVPVPESHRATLPAGTITPPSRPTVSGKAKPKPEPEPEPESDQLSPPSARTTPPSGLPVPYTNDSRHSRNMKNPSSLASRNSPISASDQPAPPSKPTPPSDKHSPLRGKPTIATEIPYSSRAPTVPAQPAVRWSDPRPPASGDFPSGTAHALGIQSVAPGTPSIAPGAQSVAPGTPSDAPTVRSDARGVQADQAAVPSSRRLPVVFVATRDPELVRRFSAWLDPQAVVVRVSRLIDLLLDLEDVGKRRTVIIFDYRRPPWRPEALSALAEELPDETRVLLWGATRESQAELGQISARVTRWMACPETMPLADVVERCVKLVG
jgi:hypothetical protein